LFTGILLGGDKLEDFGGWWLAIGCWLPAAVLWFLWFYNFPNACFVASDSFDYSHFF
jgi:hypothetical protein